MKTKAFLNSEFVGFGEDGFQFLKKLARNNQRARFQARKIVFEQTLLKPMAELMFAVERATAESNTLAANPKSPTFRIYRDVRLSADKTPYQNHVSGAL